MDNITHSLVGISIARGVSKKDPKFYDAAFWAAVIGSNFPDIDSAFRPIFGESRLAGLLIHRGYTHTFLFSFLLGALAAWIAAQITGFKKGIWPRLFLIGWLGILLHIAADACNEYGVHPFSPFLNRWFYGDFIFIIEPLFLVAMLPLAIFTAKRKGSSLAWIGVCLFLLGLVSFGPYTSRLVALAVIGLAAGMFWVQYRYRRVWPVYAAITLILSLFAFCSHTARNHVFENLAARFDPRSVRDIVLSPAPANPFCWRVIPRIESGGELIEESGLIGLAPRLFKPEQCFLRAWAGGLAPLDPVRPAPAGVHVPYDNQIFWRGEFRGRLSELAWLRKNDCRIEELMGFVRIPFWKRGAGSANPLWIVGDLRYDRGKNMSFSTTTAQPQSDATACTENLPHWEPPFDRP